MNREQKPSCRRRVTGRHRRLRRRLFVRQAPRLISFGLLILLVAAVSSYCASPNRYDAEFDAAKTPATSQSHQYQSVADASPAAGEHGNAPKRSARTGKNSPPTRLRPANHTAAWMARHGAVARSSSNDCMSCHQEEDCTSCHTADLAEPFSIHPPNFTVVHAIDARLSPQNCTSCHQVETFCAECHMRSGVSSADGFRPPARAEFHPPGWLDASQPNNHGVLARRDITDCASCHREQDCVSCHTGINPHPPEFRLNCRTWLQADARSCAKCHGAELDLLRGMCM